MDKVDPLVVVASLAASAVTALLFFTQKSAPAKPLVNPDIKKDQPKVVDSFTLTEIEDLVKENKAGTVALCRCWRSTKFPFCDGSHNKFNETCGDNTGPLLIKKG